MAGTPISNKDVSRAGNTEIDDWRKNEGREDNTLSKPLTNEEMTAALIKIKSRRHRAWTASLLNLLSTMRHQC